MATVLVTTRRVQSGVGCLHRFFLRCHVYDVRVSVGVMGDYTVALAAPRRAVVDVRSPGPCSRLREKNLFSDLIWPKESC